MTAEASISGRIVESLTVQAWLAIVLVGCALYLTYSLRFHPLRKVPGPSLARFTEFWRSIRYFRGTWLDDIVKLHETYGPVVRIAPNEVSFVDETAMKHFYGHGKPSLKVSCVS